MSLSPQLKKALETNLFSELHLDTLPLNEQEEFIENIGKMINQNIALRMLEELTDEQAAELKQKLEASPESPDLLTLYVREKLPNYDEVVQEEVAAAKDDLIKRFGK